MEIRFKRGEKGHLGTRLEIRSWRSPAGLFGAFVILCGCTPRGSSSSWVCTLQKKESRVTATVWHLGGKGHHVFLKHIAYEC